MRILLIALALAVPAVIAPSALAVPCEDCPQEGPTGPGGGGGGSPAPVTVTGTFRYTDSNGTRPIAHARVQIWSFAPRGCCGVWSWAPEKNVTTDAAGVLSTTMPFVDSGVVYAVRVFATNYAAEVYPNDVAHTVPFHREPGEPGSPFNRKASNGSVDFSYTFPDQFASQHFNIAETIRHGYDYAQARRDPSESDTLPRAAVQPTSATPTPGVSWYNAGTDTIVISTGDVFDDGTILHEYAHFVQEQISSLAWIVGNHNGCNFDDVKQAWLEGFADYFASVVFVTAAPAPAFQGIPAPGLGRIEAPACANVGSAAIGDRFELFVAAGLWDLFDQPADAFANTEAFDGVSRRDTDVFQILDRELDTSAYPTIADFRRAWIARGLDMAALDRVFAANQIPPGFRRLDGEFTSSPAAASWGSGRLDVFVRGLDNDLWQKTYDGSWRNWAKVPGNAQIVGEPAAVSWGAGRLDVFARGTDNQLYHTWYDGGGWAGYWEPLGGELTSGPAVASWGSGRLDVFVRWSDGDLWQRTYDGAWGAWTKVPGSGQLVGDPAVVSWDSGRIDAFVRGTDNQLYHTWYDGGGWSGYWESLGGQLASAPAAGSWGSGRLDVFARWSDGTLHQIYHDNGWSGWVPLGGRFASDPETVSWGPGRVDVLVRGTDNALWHKWYDGDWKP